jgi:RNA polymerase sigma-70 factor, ECF subfamily
VQPPRGATAPSVAPAGPEAADLTAAVLAAQAGDGEAFRALYRDTQPRLLRYLRVTAGEDAEDVASETWLHVARDLHGFHGDYDAFRGWVSTIARHRAVDLARSRSRRLTALPMPTQELPERPAAEDTAESALRAISTDAAVALIGTLPPDQAEAVLLRAVLGLSAEAAAGVLGKRPGAVRTAAYRGLRRLARQLGQAGSEAGGAGPGPPGS